MWDILYNDIGAPEIMILYDHWKETTIYCDLYYYLDYC